MPSAEKVVIVGASGYAADVNSSGALEVDATITPSGTQDVNLKQVNGATVAVGHGVAATAQRVELPTDGTGQVAISQTTPGTTNAIVFPPLATSLLTSATVDISSATTTELVAAGAGAVTIRVYRIFLVIGAADNLTFKSATNSLNGGVLTFTGPGSFVLDYTGVPWFVTAAAAALNLTTSTTAQVSGVVYYVKS